MLLLVSDGVGTKPKDYLASATVRQAIIDYLIPLKEIKNYDVEAAVSGANEILKQGVQGVKGMLATLSLLVWDKGKNRFLFSNVGDSRLYGFTGSELVQLSVDDVKRLPFMENGKVKLSKGVPLFVSGLSRALGDESITVDVAEIDFTEFTGFALVSDGLYNCSDFERLLLTCFCEPQLEVGIAKLSVMLESVIEDDASLSVIRWLSMEVEPIVKIILEGKQPDANSVFYLKFGLEELIHKGIKEADAYLINQAVNFMISQNIVLEKQQMINWLNEFVRIPGVNVSKVSGIIRKL